MKISNNYNSNMTSSGHAFLALIRQLFALKPETDYVGTIQQVRSEVEFSSEKIWALVFASLIASIGLNINSTAVIIGAMLISPLMGPIVGAGFGLATNDFPLLRRSARNLFIAAAVALLASALYFAVSPLNEVQSEIFARTRPTLYDVLIALCGGGAGVVAVSRKSNKSNVVPGVAIATALIPPLCTAGFGLAQGNLWYFSGALYLFFINALFICLSTLGFIRLMRFNRVAELNPAHLMRVRVIIVLITMGIVIPSIYTGWSVVQEARFKNMARRFVSENLNFPDRSILNIDLKYSHNGSTIKATVLGKPLSKDLVQSLKERLPAYGLKGTSLALSQPAENQASAEQVGQAVRQGIIEDIYKRNEQTLASRDDRIHVLEDEIVKLHSTEFPIQALTKELSALYPTLVSIGVGREEMAVKETTDSSQRIVVVASWRKMPSSSDKKKLRSFLELRLGLETLHLVNTVER
jgi:uncharacterized hydrophobic protein (TIGR00271 family)